MNHCRQWWRHVRRRRGAYKKAILSTPMWRHANGVSERFFGVVEFSWVVCVRWILLFYKGNRVDRPNDRARSLRTPSSHVNQIITPKLQIYARFTRNARRSESSGVRACFFMLPRAACTLFELCISPFFHMNHITSNAYCILHIAVAMCIRGKHTFKLILNWMLACAVR